MCIHTDCSNYVKDFDMCLVYADLGFFNIRKETSLSQKTLQVFLEFLKQKGKVVNKVFTMFTVIMKGVNEKQLLQRILTN